MITLNIPTHRIVMTTILLDFFKESSVSPFIAFKGGTAAMLFYNLPRFSVDLDFDYLQSSTTGSANKKYLFDSISKILHNKYRVTDECKKFNTLFWVVSYRENLTQVKIEISTSDNLLNHYHSVQFYGVSMQIMNAEDMIVYKMIAIMTRNQMANRDLFDLHYFLQSPYASDINYSLLEALTKKPAKEYLLELMKKLSKVKPSNLLNGLGEVLNANQKKWVKKELLHELHNLLQLQVDQL